MESDGVMSGKECPPCSRLAMYSSTDYCDNETQSGASKKNKSINCDPKKLHAPTQPRTAVSIVLLLRRPVAPKPHGFYLFYAEGHWIESCHVLFFFFLQPRKRRKSSSEGGGGTENTINAIYIYIYNIFLYPNINNSFNIMS